MKYKLALTKILILLFISSAFSQKSGKFLSIKEGLKNPLSVKELQLSGIKEKLPKDIKEFKNLETIRLINLSEDYDLNNAFKKLGKYTEVKKIYLYGNPHSELPPTLSNIKTLEFIELNSNLTNSLSAIIEQLSALDNFKSLSLRSMRLSKLPDNITKLKLIDLNLDNNPNLDLYKEFEVLGKMNIEKLDISSSNFTVIPTNIKNLTSLKRLVIEMNNGKFNNVESYENLSKLKNLKELNIQGNFFGNLDPAIEKLNYLELIEIDGNCIVGESYEKLKKLLPNTKIQNEIPC